MLNLKLKLYHNIWISKPASPSGMVPFSKVRNWYSTLCPQNIRNGTWKTEYKGHVARTHKEISPSTNYLTFIKSYFLWIYKLKNANQTPNHAMFLFSVHDGFESHKNAEFVFPGECSLLYYRGATISPRLEFTLTYQLVNVPIRLLYHVSGEHKYNQSMENLPDFLFTGVFYRGSKLR